MTVTATRMAPMLLRSAGYSETVIELDPTAGPITIANGTAGTLKVTVGTNPAQDNIPADTILTIKQSGTDTITNNITVSANVTDGVNITLAGFQPATLRLTSPQMRAR